MSSSVKLLPRIRVFSFLLLGAREKLAIVTGVATDGGPVLAKFRVCGARVFVWARQDLARVLLGAREKLATVVGVAADGGPVFANFRILGARARKELAAVLGVSADKGSIVALFHVGTAEFITRAGKEFAVVFGVAADRRPVTAQFRVECAHARLFATHQNGTSWALFAPKGREGGGLRDTAVVAFVAVRARITTLDGGTLAKAKVSLQEEAAFHNGGSQQPDGDEIN